MKRFIFALIALITLSAISYCAPIYYDDPVKIGIGARVIGMGRAFVAISDDNNAIFMNPAGLATQKSWSLSTMSSNFMDEFQYSMFSMVFPGYGGTYGLGYVLSRTGGIYVTGGGIAEFYNQALILSYGQNVGDSLSSLLGQKYKIYSGISLKYFGKGYTGDIQANGAGFNMDMGFKWEVNRFFSWGLNFQNIFLGSKIAGEFAPEELPLSVKLGTALYLLDNKLKLALDDEMNFGRDVPWPVHFGFEWVGHPNLILRAGMDQVIGAAGGDLNTNTTFGIGFVYDGLKVDLAYMQNFIETNIASSILSLSFYSQELPFVEQEKPKPQIAEAKPVEEKPAPPPPPEQYAAPVVPYVAPKPLAQRINLFPPDRFTTFFEDITFYGSVESDVSEIFIDDRRVPISPDRSFQQTVALEIGKNVKSVRLTDLERSQALITRRIVRFYLPLDMLQEDAQRKYFEYKVIYTELFNYLKQSYTLDKKFTRDILAMVLAKTRALNTPQPDTAVSKDVTYNYWAAKYIRAVKFAGFMQDYSDGTFKPQNLVTIGELATIMANISGQSQNTILSYILSYIQGKQLNEGVTVRDLVAVFYNTNLFEDQIVDYRDFLGLGRSTL